MPDDELDACVGPQLALSEQRARLVARFNVLDKHILYHVVLCLETEAAVRGAQCEAAMHNVWSRRVALKAQMRSMTSP